MDEQRNRLSDEREAFATVYPDTPWETVPDRVKEAAADGTRQIAAEYSSYLYRKEQLRTAAAAAREKGRAESPGLPAGAYGERLYSIDEMRRMSPKEVKGRYKSILSSLKRGLGQ